METKNKNIIYTHVPPVEWKTNIAAYISELFYLLYSVEVFKKNFEYLSIKLYTNNEFVDFFKGTEIFNEVKDIFGNYNYIRKQDSGSCHKNMLFKMFTIEDQNHQFLHLDNDMIIGDPETFKRIEHDILFSYEERVIDHRLDEGYYDFYFKTLSQVIKLVDGFDEIERFNPISAVNCSIFGGDDINELKRSFGESTDFFKRNYQQLNQVPNMPAFIEQYLQFSILLKNRDINEVSFLNENLRLPDHYDRLDEVLEHGVINNDVNELDVDHNLLVDLKRFVSENKNTHLSYMRWRPPCLIVIYNLLKELNPNIVNKIQDIYGKQVWFKEI